MAKTDWKAKAKELKKKLKAIKQDQPAAAPAKSPKPVSPLAPAAFPKLPQIAGVEFAAVEAGVKYKDRKDVMLVRLAPGTAMAGVFTRSTTRSACVRDCQDKLAMKVPVGAGAAIVVALAPATAVAGVLTQSRCSSPEVELCRARLAGGRARAVVINAGNSNAFTGKVGDQAVAAVTNSVATALGLPASRVFSSSTGVIGEPLPYDKITAQIPALTDALRQDAIEMAAHAMMT
ncbi:MAG: bifunctional ornithine acetyltransferase/N-acetylglutamate synthase, partial [Cypionkella sp.]